MGGWKLFGHAKAKHDAIRLENQCKRRFFHHQAKAKRVAVEVSRARDVDNGHESNDVVLTESAKL